MCNVRGTEQVQAVTKSEIETILYVLEKNTRYRDAKVIDNPKLGSLFLASDISKIIRYVEGLEKKLDLIGGELEHFKVHCDNLEKWLVED